MWGRWVENGVEWLLLVSVNDVLGCDFYFFEFNQLGVSDGVVCGMDYDCVKCLFVKGSFGEFGLIFGYVDCMKGVLIVLYD